MKRDGVLVVGAGFLGRAVAARLAAGSRPHWVLTRQGGADLGEVLPRCAVVLHAASATTPGSSAGQPQLELEANVAPLLALAAALRPHPEIHLVYVSTGGALYGDLGTRAATEDDPPAPRSFHGAGKAAIEAFLQAESAQTGRVLTVLRPSNFYGPGQAPRAGFGVIRAMLEHLRRGSTLEIYGDGEVVRDYLYIGDMVEACARFLAPDAVRGTFNVATGIGHSLNQLRAIVERVCGATLRVAHVPAREVDLRHAVLDASRLQRRLGWRPAMTIEPGIRATWDWVRAQRA